MHPTHLKTDFPGMTYDEHCYLVIDVNLDSEATITFYNPAQDPEKTYENLEQFAESYLESNFNFYKADNAYVNNEPNKATAYGVVSEGFGGDYSYEGQMVDIYKGKKIEDIPQLIKASFKDLENIKKQVEESNREGLEYAKDPHGYHGVKPSDFY